LHYPNLQQETDRDLSAKALIFLLHQVLVG